MTREQAIERWKDIARAVILAEDHLDDEWKPRFQMAAEMSSDEQIVFIDEYYTAIAEEILSKTSDEDLEKMELK